MAADNINVTPGAGAVVAADSIQVDGTHTEGLVQFVKLVDGTLNGTEPIAVDEGTITNALRICPASNISDATYIGDIKFGEAEPNSAAILTALQIIDDWDDTDKCKVIIQTGANAIGKLAANTGVDIGDVDVTSIVPGVAATNLGKAEDAGHTTGDVGVMALTVRKDAAAALGTTDVDYQPLITDANGRLHVLDANSANILTAVQLIDNAIDGNYLNVNLNIVGTDCDGGSGAQGAQTLRVILATDDPAVAHLNNILTAVQIMDDWDESDRAKVNPIVGQVGVQGAEGTITALTQRVTLATDDDGVAHLATIAGDTTGIETAVEIIDDWDATHAGAASADGPQVMGAGYSAGLPTDVGADGDAARICTDRHGRIVRGLMPQNFQATFTSADAQAASPVKVKTGSRKMYILSLVVSVDTEMSVQFQDDTGPTILIEQMYFAANGGAHLTYPPEAPLVVNTNEDFDVITSAAGNISVTITGYLAV